MTPHADTVVPEDPAALLAVIAALRGELAEERAARRAAELGLQAKTLEAEQLRVQIARLRQERFGRSSERLAAEIAQLELRLDEVLADIAAADDAEAGKDETASAKAPEEKERRRGRKPLPESLPRREVEHLPAQGCACEACGGALRKVGEDVTEILEYRPGRFEVVRHVRPAFSCRACETMTQAPMESFFSSLKTERVARKVYRTRDQARADVFDYIERFYNPRRRHSTIGYLSPMAFEQLAKTS